MRRFMVAIPFVGRRRGVSPRTWELEAVFPLPLQAVWTLLHAHLDDNRLREIHPWILSGRTTQEEGTADFAGLSFPREKLAERVVKIGGRSSRTTWRYWIEPPRRYAYEAAFENGSVIRFDNTYTEVETGTLVHTSANVSIKGVPSFLTRWLVNRSLNRTEDEDLAYARKMGL